MLNRMNEVLNFIDNKFFSKSDSTEIAQFHFTESSKLTKAGLKYYIEEVSSTNSDYRLFVSDQGMIYSLKLLNNDKSTPLTWQQCNVFINEHCAKQFENLTHTELGFDMTDNKRNYNGKVKPLE